MAVLNKECFPELPQFLQTIDAAWTQQNTFIVKDVEQGYKNLISALQNLPANLSNCDEYTEDMNALAQYLTKFDVDSQEFNDELF